jgi:hypothetical protein
MQSFFKLKPFHIYNIILFILFSLIVNKNQNLIILYYSIYSAFHILLIYLGIYHYRSILFIIYFLYGLILDILLFNEIGPHLLVFMITLIFLKLLLKYLYGLNSFKIYILLIFMQSLMIFSEIFLGYIFFDFKFDFIFFIKIIILCMILSYPIFILFSKIDQIK